MIPPEVKELIDREAAVYVHKKIGGNRLSYTDGATVWAERCMKLREALIEISELNEVHSYGVSTAREALAEFDAELEGK